MKGVMNSTKYNPVAGGRAAAAPHRIEPARSELARPPRGADRFVGGAPLPRRSGRAAAATLLAGGLVTAPGAVAGAAVGALFGSPPIGAVIGALFSSFALLMGQRHPSTLSSE